MISCIILAGGKSERMGKDKRSLELEGKPFLERVLETAHNFSDEVIISLGSDDQIAGMKLEADKVAVDEVPDSGPLGGLMTALKLCEHKYTAVAPCDSPLLKAEVFMFMADRASGYDAVVPKNGELIEPLHAIYKVATMLSACQEAFSEGYLGVTNALGRLDRVRYVNVEEFKDIDQELLTFFNVNYPRDLTKINELMRHEKR
ncbi:MAG: molybdenum cofactor guanylyltransferase [Candidatus Hydrothermarchaeales archaeon]